MLPLLLAGCTDVATPDAGELLVADYAADAIFRFDAVTGAPLGVFAQGTAARVDRPAGLRAGPDGQLYSAGFGRGEVVRYDLASGQMMDVFFWDTTLLEEPVELAFAGDEVLVLGNDTANIVAIDPTGHATRSFGAPLMRDAHDFVVDGARVLVGTDQSATLGHAIQIWDLARGTLQGSFGTPAELTTATSLALAGDRLLVADWERDRVVAFDAASGAFAGVFADGFTGPVALEVTEHGVDVLDRSRIRRYALDGTPRGVVVEGAGVLRYPRALTRIATHSP